MRLTEELRAALAEAVRRLGSQAEVARQSGLHEVYIGRYLAGRNQTLSDDNGEKLLRFLQAQHLSVPATDPTQTIPNTPELRCYIQDAMIERGAQYPTLARAANMKPDSLRRLLRGELNSWFPGNLAKLLAELKLAYTDAPLPPAERALLHPTHQDGGVPTRPCWVLTMAQAATLDNLRVSLEPDSGWECAVIPITDARDCVAFRIEGKSMEPRYFAGDIVICDKHAELVNGKPVVAKFRGQVVCKLYHRVGKTVLLSSVHPEGETYELDAGEVDWMVRVIRFQRDE
jgi:hypothetical protein